MRITIETDQSLHALGWLQDLLTDLAARESLRITYQYRQTPEARRQFLAFAEKNALRVEKLDIPDRDERNQR